MTMPAVIYYNPPRLLDTPKGPAYCDFVIDYDMHQCFYYHCWVRETGEAWTFRNTEVRLHPCETTKVRIEETKPKPAFLRGPPDVPEPPLRTHTMELQGAIITDLSADNASLRKLLREGEELTRALPHASPISTVRQVVEWGWRAADELRLRPPGSPVQASVTPPGVAGAAAPVAAAGDPSQPVAGATQRGRGAPRRGGRRASSSTGYSLHGKP